MVSDLPTSWSVIQATIRQRQPNIEAILLNAGDLSQTRAHIRFVDSDDAAVVDCCANLALASRQMVWRTGQ
jgi:hypothetical protein